jgi:hypothetical protein
MDAIAVERKGSDPPVLLVHGFLRLAGAEVPETRRARSYSTRRRLRSA